MSVNINTIEYLEGDGLLATKPSGATKPSVTSGIYDRTLLDRAQPHLLHQRFGQQRPLRMRSGQSIVFRRYEKLAQVTQPLADGVTPPGVMLTHTDYVATIKPYGNFTIVSDWTEMTSVDPVMLESTELMGENMGESMDSVYREILVTGTSFYCVVDDDAGTYSVGTTRGNIAGTLCKSVVDSVIRDLDGADAKKFTPMIPGSTRVNTHPVGSAYWCLIHTDQIHDLFALNGGMDLGSEFIPVKDYSNHTGVMESEVGSYRNVRFVATTNAKVFRGAGAAVGSTGLKSTGGNIDVYCALFFARDAYGIVPLQRGAGRVISQAPGGPSDPLEQRGTVGWKAAGTCVILNDAFMCRVECGTLA